MGIRKRCPACGVIFECYAPEGDVACWCETVSVSPTVLVELARRYRDCLCPQCLSHGVRDLPRPSVCPIEPCIEEE